MQTIYDDIKTIQNSYLNNFNSNSIEQHFIDSRWDCIILGITKSFVINHEYFLLDNKEIISVPYKDLRYNFYIKTQSDKGKDLYFIVTPTSRMSPNISSEGIFACISDLSINCIDDIEETLANTKFAYKPIYDDIPFVIVNNRASLNDDTYYLSINDTEIGFVQQTNEGLSAISLAPVEDMFFVDEDIIEDKYTKEIEKYANKICKNFNFNPDEHKIFAQVLQEINYNDNVKFLCKAFNITTKEYYGFKVVIDKNTNTIVKSEKLDNIPDEDTVYDYRTIFLLSGLNLSKNKFYQVVRSNDTDIAYSIIPKNKNK